MGYSVFYLTKKNGEKRRICNPDPILKRKLKRSLKGIYSDFRIKADNQGVREVFHGFLKGKNCVTAATKHVGFKTTIMMDIKDFFGSVTKDMVEYTGMYFDENGTTPQGFPTSPVIANMAFIDSAKYVQDYLEYNFKDFAFTVYADDIAISVNTEDYSVSNEIIRKVTWILSTQGFKINEKKTRIKYAKFGYRRILGLNVGDHIRPTKKIVRKIRAAKHQGNSSSLGGLQNWAACHLPKRK